jgi:hypothetical protein
LQQTAKPKRDFFVCGGYSVSGPIRGELGKYGYKCLFCGSYRCKRCRGPKLKRVRRRLIEIAEEHKLQRFVTLTLDPKKIPPADRKRTDRYIRELWRMMRVLLARHFGKSIAFVGVLEFQKNGNAHLHLLVGQYISQKWLSIAWQSIGGGRFVDIRSVDVQRIAAYLTKYLTGEKIEHTLRLLPKRARIFTTARSIVLWGKKEKRGWKLRRADIGTLYDAAENPSNVRWEAVEDLKPFGLELLSYFESPPCATAFGNLDVLEALRAALPYWKADKKFRAGNPGEVRKPITKG